MAISVLALAGLPLPKVIFPSGGTAEITVTKPSALLAPAQVWVDASSVTGLASFEESGDYYEPEFHEYYYEWTVNGEPLADWDKPVNLIAAHNNPNKAFGKEVAFCLTDPGDYVIDLVVTDRLGNTATASTSTITVQDPLDYFPENRRIYVDSSGAHSGVPAASYKATTLEDAQDAVDANTNQDTCILFRRGDTWSFGDFDPANANKTLRGSWRINDTNAPVFYMGAYGTGANPKFTPNYNPDGSSAPVFAIWDGPGQICFTVCHLDFEGEYDTTTERGDWAQDGAFTLNQCNSPFVNLHDVNVTRMGKGFYVDQPGVASMHVMVSNCAITEYYDYGLFGGSNNQRLAYMGNLITRDGAALWGQSSRFTNYHGGIRIPASPAVYISGNDVFSKGAWDAFDQPCLRLCVSTGLQDQAIVERNCFEGGYEVIQILKKASTGGAADTVPMNAVIERNTLVSTALTGAHIAMNRSGITIRDNLFIFPNAPRHPGIGSIYKAIEGYETDINTPDPSNITDPIAIYGNTALNLVNSANDGIYGFTFWRNIADYFENVILENNVVHAPDIDTPQVDFSPIDTTTLISGLALRYAGYRAGFDPIKPYSSPATTNGNSFTVPYSALVQTLTNGDTSLGGATNQAYWQAIEATDVLHQIYIGGDQKNDYFAEKGHFTVSFDGTGAVITNTSGIDWPAATDSEIHLDRTSLIPAIVGAAANPPDVPLPRPQTGSAAIGAATTGRVSPKDFLLTDRGATPSKGALEPA